MCIFKKIFIVLFFSCKILAEIPGDFQVHITENIDEIKRISECGFSEDQVNLMIERYIDSMAFNYGLLEGNYDRKEVFSKIKDIVPVSKILANMQQFNFNNIKIPFSTTEEPNGELILTLNGILKNVNFAPFSQGDPDCLQITLSDEKESIHVDWLNTADVVCPLPSFEHQGRYLLSLVEAIGKKLDYKIIELEDTSEIICPDTACKATLAYLRVFAKGETWYNSQGFFSVWGRAEDLKKAQNLQQFSLEKINKAFNEIDEIDKILLFENQFYDLEDWQMKLVNEYYERFSNRLLRFNKKMKRYSPSHSTLGKFFTTLWNEDPYSYMEIFKLIVPEYSFSVFPREFDWVYQLQLNLDKLHRHI